MSKGTCTWSWSWSWILFSGLILGTYAGDVNDGVETLGSENHLKIYKKLFSYKRKEQVATAEQVWSIPEYEKQYKTIKFLIETIFPVLKQSLLEVTEMKYVPGTPFPEDQEQREVIGKIYENVMLFGDILLRMPHMTKTIFKGYKKEWMGVLEETFQFCNASKELFTGPHARQLHLMAQEIGIIPEEEDFVNPFRVTSPQQNTIEKPTKIKRKPKSRGPKLRGVKSRVEL